MLRIFVIVLLGLHGAIHMLGFASALGLQRGLPFQKPVGPLAGALWLAAGALLLAAAGLLLARSRLWWVAGLPAVLASQVLIFVWWRDARFGTIANVILLVPIVMALAGVMPGSAWQRLRAHAAAGFARSTPQLIVTETDLASLPPPIQRYLRFVGVVGKPRVLNFAATFRGTIAGTRESPRAPFFVRQISFFDEPSRLFLLEAGRAGVPFEAFHSFVGREATMQVKVASLITVVNAKGPKMNQSETVTTLNDMCVLAPATLLHPNLSWQEQPDGRVKVIFRHAGNTVAALLTFDDDGALVGFISNDRYQSSDGKSFVQYPWSTPLKDYRDYHGIRLASRGEATWQEPEGDLTYGDFELIDIVYNVDRLPESW